MRWNVSQKSVWIVAGYVVEGGVGSADALMSQHLLAASETPGRAFGVLSCLSQLEETGGK